MNYELKEQGIQYCFLHCGHFVAPIIIDCEHNGTMFAGQFMPQKLSAEPLKRLGAYKYLFCIVTLKMQDTGGG